MGKGNVVPRITEAEHIGPDDTGDNIEAKRVANYIWNPAAGLAGEWERDEGGGSSGGGAVTIADGDDIAEGSTTDAAVTTDTVGTVSGKLRGLVKWAYERMPTSLGQKSPAASFPIIDAASTTRIDEASSTVTYIGTASAGSTTSAASWQVKKIDSSSGTSITYADGNINYDNIWDDRASLSYS